MESTSTSTSASARILGALGQSTRLAIYRLLAQCGPTGLAVGSIGDTLNLAPATLSFHLRGLSQAGLIRARQQGRFIYYSVDAEAMQNLISYLAEICDKSAASQEAPTEVRHPSAAAAKPVVRPKTRAA